MRNLCWIVTARILRKDPHAKIVITGDFNAYGLPLVVKALKGTDLEPVIPLEEPTHNRGAIKMTFSQIWRQQAPRLSRPALVCLITKPFFRKLTYRKEEQKQVLYNAEEFFPGKK